MEELIVRIVYLIGISVVFPVLLAVIMFYKGGGAAELMNRPTLYLLITAALLGLCLAAAFIIKAVEVMLWQVP